VSERLLRELAPEVLAAVARRRGCFEVATPERAEEIAVRWPDAQRWGMEIRPLMHSSGEAD
jgi:hypothetical protein